MSAIPNQICCAEKHFTPFHPTSSPSATAASEKHRLFILLVQRDRIAHRTFCPFDYYYGFLDDFFFYQYGSGHAYHY